MSHTERRLNELFESMLRSGYDEFQAVDVTVCAAIEGQYRASDEDIEHFIVQPRVMSIIVARERDVEQSLCLRETLDRLAILPDYDSSR